MADDEWTIFAHSGIQAGPETEVGEQEKPHSHTPITNIDAFEIDFHEDAPPSQNGFPGETMDPNERYGLKWLRDIHERIKFANRHPMRVFLEHVAGALGVPIERVMDEEAPQILDNMNDLADYIREAQKLEEGSTYNPIPNRGQWEADRPPRNILSEKESEEKESLRRQARIFVGNASPPKPFVLQDTKEAVKGLVDDVRPKEDVLSKESLRELLLKDGGKKGEQRPKLERMGKPMPLDGGKPAALVWLLEHYESPGITEANIVKELFSNPPARSNVDWIHKFYIGGLQLVSAPVKSAMETLRHRVQEHLPLQLRNHKIFETWDYFVTGAQMIPFANLTAKVCAIQNRGRYRTEEERIGLEREYHYMFRKYVETVVRSLDPGFIEKKIKRWEPTELAEELNLGTLPSSVLRCMANLPSDELLKDYVSHTKRRRRQY